MVISIGKIISLFTSKSKNDLYYYLTKQFYTVGTQFIFIFLGTALLKEFTKINLLKSWETLTYRNFFLLIYLLINIVFAVVESNKFKNFQLILDARSKQEHPKPALLLFLIQFESIEIYYERKLALLKSFSPVPIVLLLFTNFSNLISDFDFRNSFLDSLDSINIILILFLLAYFYLTINTFRKCNQNSLLIRRIKIELHYLENPGLIELI